MGTITRLFRHLFAPGARRYFSAPTLERIAQAIAQAEARHTGEVRFAVEGAMHPRAVLAGLPVRARAEEVFAQLRVWDTRANNGVLLYVELADHGVEIVADRGIARLVPAAEWQGICSSLREHFRRSAFEDGVTQAIGRIGAQLTEHFPLQPGDKNPNELSDKPVIL